MSKTSFVPEVFSHLVDLASDQTGAFVVHATDDYFAEKDEPGLSDAQKNDLIAFLKRM